MKDSTTHKSSPAKAEFAIEKKESSATKLGHTDPDGEEDEAERKKRFRQGPKVGVRTLFSFADKYDVALIVLGTLCAAAVGSGLPLSVIFFGNTITGLSVQPSGDLLSTSIVAFACLGAGGECSANLPAARARGAKQTP